MQQHTAAQFIPTVGLDLGSKNTHVACLDSSGRLVRDFQVETTKVDLAELFDKHKGCRVVMEASSQAHWIFSLAVERGLEVVVANPRRVPLITTNIRKCDRNDAVLLAEIGQLRPDFLCPVNLRSMRFQYVRQMIFARDILVAKRTSMVTFVRSIVKEVGERLPTCGANCFSKKMRGLLPSSRREILEPLLDVIGVLTEKIASYDRKLEALATVGFPEVAILQQVHGVGMLTALAYIATIGDPTRFAKSRSVGAYLGLVPGSKQSGEYNPEMRITKCGDAYMRRLLVSAASKLLGPFGADSDLRRFGLSIIDKGGKRAKSRARIAVARKLAVLLHALLKTGEVYEPLRNSSDDEVLAA